MRLEWIEQSAGQMWLGVARVKDKEYYLRVWKEENKFCLETTGGFFEATQALFYDYNIESLKRVAERLISMIETQGDCQNKH